MEGLEESNSCFICKKDLAGEVVADRYTGMSGALWELEKAEEIEKIGFACSNCGVWYCYDHRKELGASIWSGYQNAICSNCGQQLMGAQSGGSSLVILRPRDEQIKEKMQQLLAQADIEEATEFKEPQGFHFLVSEEEKPKECISCGGTNIRAVKRPIASARSRLIDIVIGLVGLLGLLYLVQSGRMNELEGIWYIVILLGAYVWIFGFLWKGLTLRPIPFLGRYLIAPGFESQAFCQDCGHGWTIEKTALAN